MHPKDTTASSVFHLGEIGGNIAVAAVGVDVNKPISCPREAIAKVADPELAGSSCKVGNAGTKGGPKCEHSTLAAR